MTPGIRYESMACRFCPLVVGRTGPGGDRNAEGPKSPFAHPGGDATDADYRPEVRLVDLRSRPVRSMVIFAYRHAPGASPWVSIEQERKAQEVHAFDKGPGSLQHHTEGITRRNHNKMRSKPLVGRRARSDPVQNCRTEEWRMRSVGEVFVFLN